MPGRHSIRAVGLLVLVATAGCGTVQIKPPPAPPPQLPTGVELGKNDPRPEPTDASRVYVTTDVPAHVLLASGGTVVTRNGESIYVPTGTVLCESTPCVLTVPFGDYELAFIGSDDRDRESVIAVHAEHTTEVVNHRLGRHKASVAKPIGLVAMAAGVVALGITLGITEGKPTESSTALRTIGLGSVASIAFGGALFFASPTYHQEGSTTQWTPPVAGRTYSTGVGVRF